MCTIIENFIKEYTEQQVKAERIDVARALLRMGMTNENISIATHLATEEIDELRNHYR